MSSKAFRILVATDVHLGYKQNHKIRGNDSFQAFQEVLNLSEELQPDILLLGGDLFDCINPSQTCIYKCLKMLQNTVFGDKELDFELIGSSANFTNQNLNICLPIFTIHGNHDTPMQTGALSVCDLLHASNYVNYFGRFLNTNQVFVKPLVFQKNDTTVAIYGLGYIHPFRLSRLFQDNKIKFQNPPENSYNIIIVHQNKYKGKTSGVDSSECLHPEQLPSWINLVIWCHEHESIPKFYQEQNKNIYQPGSTIPTSLIQSEAIMKHAGLLQIQENQCKMTPHFLQNTYRHIPIISINLDEIDLLGIENLQKKIIQMVESEMEERIGQTQRLPLLRVKLEHSQKYNPKILELQRYFADKVANPSQVFKVKKIKHRSQKTNKQISLINDFLDPKKRNSARLQYYQNIHEEFDKMLQKILNKNSNLLMNPQELRQNITGQLKNLVQKGSTSRSFQNYVQSCQNQIYSYLLSRITDFQRMITCKYTNSRNYYIEKIGINLNGKSGKQEEFKENNKPSNKSVMQGVEFEAMWQVKINQIENLQLQSYNEEAKRYSKVESNHKLHSLEFHDQEEQKCCVKGSDFFQQKTERQFQEMQKVVRNEKKPKKGNKKSGKEGKKSSTKKNNFF